VRNFLTPSSARRRPMCDREPIWEPDAIHLRTPIRTHSDAVRSGTALPDHLSDDVGRMVTNYRSEGLLRRGGASDDRNWGSLSASVPDFASHPLGTDPPDMRCRGLSAADSSRGHAPHGVLTRDTEPDIAGLTTWPGCRNELPRSPNVPRSS
jgi:hypothetical protein